MPSFRDFLSCTDAEVARCEADRQSLMRRELEAYLVGECEGAHHEGRRWDLDDRTVAGLEASTGPHRRGWAQALGDYRFDAPFNVTEEPFFETEDSSARLVTIDLAPGLKAQAVLALPKEAPRPMPMVLAQHGIGSSPERVFGRNDGAGLYHAYGRALLAAGYAVLAPANVTQGPPRARLHRLCLLQGKTLAGLEVGKLRRLLDFAATQPEIDASRFGMWGISLGGMYTMFLAPLDTRIKAAIICAFFNDRFAKMAVSSRLYSCFLDVTEEHIWIPGWLSGGFGDAELLSLICPRAVQVQQGRADGIGWWPLQLAEFERARRIYDKLGIGERIDYADHIGGHEILVGRGINFLDQQL